ncbi:uncharacterized protein Z518_10324 [Rhinocladiella mackenziei CBS 650.93]|uniref:Telomerase reverse transcriptase n=1 Tax=Rhinocladiella mackenziei CBS 650.93 TaxID=1442369 RepID=A0A0D2IAB2_9EURO|nr:uncharacterized protein Z518_10324 [Rhinocladiella mackenziei CBS 650.93]KIX00186.1 hypothetical protein Z518_10324 [Rhinocladiella mackenziei CBS 650.93]
MTKRKYPNNTSDRPAKLRRTSNGKSLSRNRDGAAALPNVRHAVLSTFYPKVCALRDYLLANLPSTSRVRRRKLTSYGRDEEDYVLDTCLVGVLKEASPDVKKTRKDDFATFTQSQQRATGTHHARTQRCSIKEILDFVVWLLFRSNGTKGNRPRHILCHGLRRASVHHSHGDCDGGGKPIFLPGIVQQHATESLNQFNSSPWTDILPLLGEDAVVIFSSLLLDCGVFTRLPGSNESYIQLSGTPISDLPQHSPSQSRPGLSANKQQKAVLQPASIRFVRNRMLYGKPSLNSSGKVKFGFNHAHALERLSDASRQPCAIHLLKYVFPRQFGLHNVFTSTVDSTESTKQFKDYTFRELEINGEAKKSSSKIPRRLRGEAIQLVQKIQRNHMRCSYSQLLRHYCPILSACPEISVPSLNMNHISVPGLEPTVTQILAPDASKPSYGTPSEQYDSNSAFLPHASPPARVSAFCRSVISHLLPKDAFGRGIDGLHNREVIMKRIEEFVQMRRFESMTLHHIVQNLRFSAVTWLSATQNLDQKMSKSDYLKRLELWYEFMYYVFDSLLIPLIRANFFVTESNIHRNRLFYFRHDVWKKLSEPSLAVLRLNMYVPIKPSQARQTLQSGTMGYSYLRLLPKDQGSRPITNLKRRPMKVGAGRRTLGKSVNKQLGPVFSVLNFERGRDPTPLGSALLSVGDIHDRLAQFKKMIPPRSRLYFAKVDIKSCFDSIPQRHLLDLVRSLFRESSYRTTAYSQFKSIEGRHQFENGGLSRRFVGLACPADGTSAFLESSAPSLAARKRKVIVADTGNHQVWTQRSLFSLLEEHIGNHMVKIGKKHLKQTDGIPQGSVLSSILCSYFYGSFERNELAFLDPRSSLLLRLIDDFLLVTLDDGVARRFLEVMANGDKRYGISVNPEKSLVNFDVSIKGQKVPRLHGSTFFPYCGMGIEMKTLELRKDRGRKDAFVSNTLTVESSSRPGMTWRRKILSFLKLQMHAMLLDMSLNSRKQVISTLLGNMTECAMKMHQYAVSLPRESRPSQELIRSLIEELVSAGTKICKFKNNDSRPIRRTQMCWIAATAFERVLSRKQSQYQEVLVWARSLRECTEANMRLDRKTLGDLLAENEKSFRGYVY